MVDGRLAETIRSESIWIPHGGQMVVSSAGAT